MLTEQVELLVIISEDSNQWVTWRVWQANTIVFEGEYDYKKEWSIFSINSSFISALLYEGIYLRFSLASE